MILSILVRVPLQGNSWTCVTSAIAQSRMIYCQRNDTTYTMETKPKRQQKKEKIMMNKNVKEKVKAIDKEVSILYTLYRVLLSSFK